MSSGRQQPIDANTLSLEHAERGGVATDLGPLVADVLYAGLFTAGSGGYAMYSVFDWDAFVAEWQRVSGEGLRLVGVDAREADERTTQFTGAYAQGDGGHALYRTADEGEFLRFFHENRGSLRLADLSIQPSGQDRLFTGTWVAGAARQELVHDLAWDALVAEWTELSGQGMRLARLQAFPSVDEMRFTGLFEAGEGGYALLRTTDWDEFAAFYRENEETLALVDFRVYDQDGARWYLGVWRETAAAHAFVFGVDWASFVQRWNELSAQGLRLVTARAYDGVAQHPEPHWATVYDEALGTSAEGYAYLVARDGVLVGEGVHLARSAYQPVNPGTGWGLDTRINLASVSKPVTAVALLTLVRDGRLGVDDPFIPLLAARVGRTNPELDVVTLKQLLQMKSGMVPDGSLNGDLWPFLRAYLQQGLVGTPGETYAYSNTSFTLLQAVIEVVSGQPYVEYVTEHVLAPMGIDPAVFNATPDPDDAATLSYAGAGDTRPGQYWRAFDFVAPGGWIASARELIKFVNGVRAHTVLPPALTYRMLADNLGWYTWDGVYGQYFHHNGGLLNGLSPRQELSTGIVRFSNGYDAVLLVNSPADGAIALMVEAFESRGMSVDTSRLRGLSGVRVAAGIES